MMKKTAISLACAAVATVGMTSAAVAGSWKTEAAGGFNSVHTYTPDTVSPVGDGRSLMIVLHGCTQSNGAFKTANLDKVAEEWGMVVTAPDARHKEGFSCWGYWTGSKSRSAGDYKNVINLAKEYTADANLDIDPNQVYVAGLSSGGAFAMTVGCLAPDVFAGMGLDAAPSAGTSSNGAFSQEGSASSVARSCKSYAGSNSSYFDTQVTSTAYGTGDYTVPQGYGKQNADAMASIYGVSKLSGSNSIQGGAKETLYGGDGVNRVTTVELSGVSHAWPGGSGASGSYIDGSSINYGMYLAEYFANNNPRIEGPVDVNAPTIAGLTATPAEDGASVVVEATVEPAAGTTLTAVTVVVDGTEYDSPIDGYVSVEAAITGDDHTVEVIAQSVDAEGNAYESSKNTTFDTGSGFDWGTGDTDYGWDTGTDYDWGTGSTGWGTGIGTLPGMGSGLGTLPGMGSGFGSLPGMGTGVGTLPGIGTGMGSSWCTMLPWMCSQ